MMMIIVVMMMGRVGGVSWLETARRRQCVRLGTSTQSEVTVKGMDCGREENGLGDEWAQ